MGAFTTKIFPVTNDEVAVRLFSICHVCWQVGKCFTVLTIRKGRGFCGTSVSVIPLKIICVAFDAFL